MTSIFDQKETTEDYDRVMVMMQDKFIMDFCGDISKLEDLIGFTWGKCSMFPQDLAIEYKLLEQEIHRVMVRVDYKEPLSSKDKTVVAKAYVIENLDSFKYVRQELIDDSWFDESEGLNNAFRTLYYRAANSLGYCITESAALSIFIEVKHNFQHQSCDFYILGQTCECQSLKTQEAAE